MAIGGWNDSAGTKWSTFISSPTLRAAFNTDALEFIQKWGFDGLDLDWEYPACPQVSCQEMAKNVQKPWEYLQLTMYPGILQLQVI